MVGIDHVFQYLIRNGRVGTDGLEQNGRVDIFIGKSTAATMMEVLQTTVTDDIHEQEEVRTYN